MVETRTDLEVIETDKAAKPIGPYSQAIRANGMIFVAGEKGIDPAYERDCPWRHSRRDAPNARERQEHPRSRRLRHAPRRRYIRLHD